MVKLHGRIFDALTFITRALALPRQVVFDAALAAERVILEYFKTSRHE